MNIGGTVSPQCSVRSDRSWCSAPRRGKSFKEVTGKLVDLRRSIEEAHDREVNKLREDLSRLRTELTRAVERLGQLKDKDRTRKRALQEADKGHEEEGRFAPLVRTPRGAITRNAALPSPSGFVIEALPTSQEGNAGDDVKSEAGQSRACYSECATVELSEMPSARTLEGHQQCHILDVTEASAASDDLPLAPTLTEEFQKIAPVTTVASNATEIQKRTSVLSRMLEIPLQRLYGSRVSEVSARSSQASQVSDRNSQVSSFSALADSQAAPAQDSCANLSLASRPLPEETNRLPPLRESVESMESTAGEDSHRLDEYGAATAQEGTARRVSMGSLVSYNSDNFTPNEDEESEFAPKFLLRDIWHLRERRSSRFVNQENGDKASIRKSRSKLGFRRTVSSLGRAGGISSALASLSFSVLKSNHGLEASPGLLVIAHEHISAVNCLLHPQSSVRIFWDVLSMLLLLLDFVTIPLQLFDLEESGIFTTLGLASTVFWTMDMLMSSITGVYLKEILVMRTRAILWHYARTWLALDLSLVVLDWVMFVQGDKESKQEINAAGTFRLLKMLRFLRLLRLLKAAKFVNVLEAMTNSNIVILGLSIVKHTVQLLMANHVIACMWYEIGKRSNGWVLEEFIESNGVPYKYTTSLHWSITQFHGTMEVNPVNATERAFATCVLFVALIAHAAFISSITNMMIQVQNLGMEKTKFEQAFRTYLQKNKVSLSLTLQVKNYIQQSWAGKETKESESSLLQQLPEELQMDLCAEIRFPIVSVHPFFAEYHSTFPRNVRRLCHEAMTATLMQQDQEVFRAGDVGSHMMFVASGSQQYTMMTDVKFSAAYTWVKPGRTSTSQPHVDEPVTIPKDAWVAEAVVWTNWVHIGDLTCKSETIFILVDPEEFARLISTHRPAHLESARYAREFIMQLNDNPSDLTRAPRGWAPVYI